MSGLNKFCKCICVWVGWGQGRIKYVRKTYEWGGGLLETYERVQSVRKLSNFYLIQKLFP